MIHARHTGLNVYSLADSLKFYVDTLGMTINETRTEQGEYIDKLTGIEGTLQHWAKVRTDDGYLLELVQWVRPEVWIPERPILSVAYSDPRINHLCFQVDTVEDVRLLLLNEHYTCREIQTDPPGKVKNFAAYDPDGNIVEFVEVLKTTEPNGDITEMTFTFIGNLESFNRDALKRDDGACRAD
jgi:catechol 2,3-dioxygenase-like lactoylglutathione lyase family enzyme